MPLEFIYLYSKGINLVIVKVQKWIDSQLEYLIP